LSVWVVHITIEDVVVVEKDKNLYIITNYENGRKKFRAN
jgi:hypothetical protein